MRSRYSAKTSSGQSISCLDIRPARHRVTSLYIEKNVQRPSGSDRLWRGYTNVFQRCLKGLTLSAAPRASNAATERYGVTKGTLLKPFAITSFPIRSLPSWASKAMQAMDAMRSFNLGEALGFEHAKLRAQVNGGESFH